MELSNFEKWINWIFRENMVKPTMDDRVPGMSERKNTHIYIYIGYVHMAQPKSM